MKKQILIISLIISFTISLTISSPLDVNADTPSVPDSSQNFVINGVGATFPFPLIDLWRVEYNKEYPNVNLNYQSIGSGGGIKQHIEKTVNFAASDAPMKTSERDLAPDTLHIPEAVGGVVIAYNIPDIPKGLRLTGGVIADIFLGKITKWNDSRISLHNPDFDLPDADIIPARRSDGSGTTFVFTDYLTSVSQEFDDVIGKGKSVPWPIGVGAAGNEGVAGIVRSTEYSIGYIELAYAFQTGMSFAYIQNGDGTAFVEPTLDTLSAASSGVANDLPLAKDNWSDVSLVNAPGDDSYPISSFTYLLVYEDLAKVTKSKSQAKAMLHMLDWMITDGQRFSKQLLYVPLSDNVISIGQQGLSTVSYNGQNLWNDTTDAMIDDNSNGGGCLVATAAFDSELAPQVQMLREVRDDVLSTSSGASFVTGFNSVYYTFSPTISDWQRENPAFNEMVRTLITPMVATLSIMTLADSGSEGDVLGLGISVIALNLAMYVGMPVFAIFKTTRYLRR